MLITSDIAKKVDLASLKSKVDKLDVGELETIDSSTRVFYIRKFFIRK